MKTILKKKIKSNLIFFRKQRDLSIKTGGSEIKKLPTPIKSTNIRKHSKDYTFLFTEQ
jgi:hypothetical protein